jgi:hypothetical protein
MSITTKLQELAKGEDLKAYVANEILDDIQNYEGSEKEKAADCFNNLFRGGCASGFVSGLIYYTDTHAFFDKYYDEIEELRRDTEEELGEPLKITSDLKNFLAWFAFEETARKIADDLNLEV